MNQCVLFLSSSQYCNTGIGNQDWHFMQYFPNIGLRCLQKGPFPIIHIHDYVFVPLSDQILTEVCDKAMSGKSVFFATLHYCT